MSHRHAGPIVASMTEPTTSTDRTVWGELTIALDPTTDNSTALTIAARVAAQGGMALALVAAPGEGASAEEAEEYLGQQAEAARQHGAASVTHHLLPAGDVAVAVLGRVADSETTMLCMPTHSRGPVAEMVLGSVSEAVLRRSPVPVLLVGPHAEVGAGDVTHLMVAYDGSEPADRALDIAGALAPRLGTDLALVQVLEPDLALPPDVAEDNVLRRAAGRLPASRTSWDVLHDDHPDRAITGAATALPNAIVVIGTHGRAGLQRVAMGSVALDVVRKALVPVVVTGAPSTADR